MMDLGTSVFNDDQAYVVTREYTGRPTFDKF